MVAFFSFPLTPLIGYNDYGGLPSPLDGRRKTPWHYDGEVYVATTLTLAAKRRLQMDAMMSTVRSATIWLSLASTFYMDNSDGDAKCLCGHGWNDSNAFCVHFLRTIFYLVLFF